MILLLRFRPPEPVEARKFTQILFVLAISFGCYIHGTTISYPALLVYGLTKTNATDRRSDSHNGSDDDASNTTDDDWGHGILPETLPFYVYKDDIALIGKMSRVSEC